MYQIRSFIRKWLAREMAHKDPSLVLFLPFQENLNDYTGRAIFTGRTTNKVGLVSRDNKKGLSSISTSAGNAKIILQRNDHINFRKTDKFTISFWLYYDSLDTVYANNPIIDRNSAGTVGGYQVKLYKNASGNGELSITYYSNPYSNQNEYRLDLFNTSFFVKKWHHILIICEPQASTQTFYIDGKPYTSNTNLIGGIYNDINSNLDLELITATTTNNYTVSLLRFYRRHLKQNEITDLYRREKALFVDYRHILRNLNLDFTFFLQAPIVYNNEIPFYTFAGTANSGDFSFYLPTISEQTNDFPFIITSSSETNNSFPFYTFAGTPSSGNFPFYLYSVLQEELTFWLQTLEPTSLTATVPFNIYSTLHSGIFNDIPFRIQCSGDKNAEFTFYVEAPNRGYLTKELTFYVNGKSQFYDAYIPFYLANSGVDGSIPFYISGYGMTPGSIPFGDGFTFYLERATADHIPFFLKTNETANSGDLPFYLMAGISVNNNMTFVMPRQDRINNEIKFYTHGF